MTDAEPNFDPEVSGLICPDGMRDIEPYVDTVNGLWICKTCGRATDRYDGRYLATPAEFDIERPNVIRVFGEAVHPDRTEKVHMFASPYEAKPDWNDMPWDDTRQTWWKERKCWVVPTPFTHTAIKFLRDRGWTVVDQMRGR